MEESKDKNMNDKLSENLKWFTENMDQKTAKYLDLKQLERIILRIGEFSLDCEDCNKLVKELLELTDRMRAAGVPFGKILIKEYQRKIQEIITHLNKKHKLLQEGYYIGLYMGIGLCFGVSLGLVFGNHISIGMPIGLCLGLAIGARLDENARKKGQVI